MAVLQVVRGVNQGANLQLDVKSPMILGRNPECSIVIPITSVSREHAQILPVNGRFFIEDLGSRNGTYVNNQAIANRTQLYNNDRIRICDFVAKFVDPNAPAAEHTEDSQGEEAARSNIEATLSASSSSLLLQQQPAEKLRLLLEITNNLSKTLELNDLMPKIVDNLFKLFIHADRCFIILAEEEGDEVRLMPKVVQTRREQDEVTARFSRGIVRACLDNAQAILSDDAAEDEQFAMNQSVLDFRIRSVMCVPLVDAKGSSFGVIQLDTQNRSNKFTKEDLELLVGVANQASIALENGRLMEDAVKQERVNRDLEIARRVQLGFLPSKLPQVEGYEFFAYYKAALQVGGDYYDYIRISDDRLVMALGDVAGKGVSAALLMAKLSSDVKSTYLTESDSATALCLINDGLEPHCSQLDKFVTMAIAVLNPQTHEVILVNGGHMSPLWYRHSKGVFEECTSRKVTGLPVGIMQGFPYESCSITLEPGDSLLMFSDGVTEAPNVRGEEFGNEGIARALAEVQLGDPKIQIEKLVRAVEIFSSGCEKQHDDITLCALGRSQ